MKWGLVAPIPFPARSSIFAMCAITSSGATLKASVSYNTAQFFRLFKKVITHFYTSILTSSHLRIFYKGGWPNMGGKSSYRKSLYKAFCEIIFVLIRIFTEYFQFSTNFKFFQCLAPKFGTSHKFLSESIFVF